MLPIPFNAILETGLYGHIMLVGEYVVWDGMTGLSHGVTS